MITRYLTISCLYPSTKSENCMPMICLCGKWLETSGFIIGNEVSVEVTRKGEIVIRAVDDECVERREVQEVRECRMSSDNLTYLN